MKRAEDILEDDTEEYLINQVKKLRGDQRKFKEHRGDPDRIVFLPGIPAFLVECKRPIGGRHQPLQKRRRAHFRNLGTCVYLCRTRADVDAVLDWEQANGPVFRNPRPQPCQG